MNSRPRRTPDGQLAGPHRCGQVGQLGFDDQRDTPLEFDDAPWEAFLPDDDQCDPLPEPGDFWIETDQLHPLSPAA